MLRTRVIPCLLLKGKGLVKTIKFKDPKYVGCPINAVRIFNEKEVDELIFLDILASVEQKEPLFKFIAEVASECFMPICYGGGIRSLGDIERLFHLGVEKVSLNTIAFQNRSLIREAAKLFGSQSIVVSLDVKRTFFGKYEVYTLNGRKNTKQDPVQCAQDMEELGAGEILLNSIDRDGAMQGYDIPMIRRVTEAVNIPVIASGGAGNIHHFSEAVKQGGASAVAAGSMFVFHGKYRAVLITYPEVSELEPVLA
jgi:cyclase